MRIAICDDMDIFLEKLRKQIEVYFCNIGAVQINEFSSGEELLENFEIGKYDAAILDVEMKKINGLQTAREIHRLDKGVVIAFHTNYNSLYTAEYNIGSYEIINKSKTDSIYQGKLEKIFNECIERNTRFHFSTGDVPIKKIIYFKKIWRKILMYTVDGTYKITGDFDSLDIPKFIRIHKSYYINTMYITGFDTGKVIVNDETELPLDRKTKNMSF